MGGILTEDKPSGYYICIGYISDTDIVTGWLIFCQYATHQLALLLEEARKIKLAGVSLIIEDGNPASVRVIEKNGGRLLRIIENPVNARVIVTDDGELQVVDAVQTGQTCYLYWIDLL